MMPKWAAVLDRLRACAGFDEATGDEGEMGLYEESDAASDGPDELATLRRSPLSAAGGRVKAVSN
tara:strand:+ start:4999 stop:5193 length:195 start_codon:yes stop_codon:yes gene_type:complete